MVTALVHAIACFGFLGLERRKWNPDACAEKRDALIDGVPGFGAELGVGTEMDVVVEVGEEEDG